MTTLKLSIIFTAFSLLQLCSSEELKCQTLGSFDKSSCTINCEVLAKNTPYEYKLTLEQNSLTLSGCISDKLSDLTAIKPQVNALSLSNSEKNVLAMKDVHCNPKLDQLDVRGYVIKVLESKLFAKCNQLKWLELRNNDIEAISPDTFLGLAALKRLDMTQNSISVIPEPVFKSLVALKTLQLDKNAIKSVIKQCLLAILL